MSTSHTPGPWKLSDGSSPLRLMSPAVRGYDLAHIYVTDPITRKRTEEYAANARLIAAAPDLLAALERILRASTGQIDQSDDDIEAAFAGIHDIARRAIATAVQP